MKIFKKTKIFFVKKKKKNENENNINISKKYDKTIQQLPAFSFKEMNNVSMRVGQHLHFNVPSFGDVAFEQHCVRAKRSRRFGSCTRHSLAQLASCNPAATATLERSRNNAHAFATAASSRFHKKRRNDRITISLNCSLKLKFKIEIEIEIEIKN